MAKYDALRSYLQSHVGEVTMTFAQLADLLPGGLPSSAYRYTAWWSNDDPSHSQSLAWTAARYEADANIQEQRVRFIPLLEPLPNQLVRV